MTDVPFDVKDPSLADAGLKRIDWALTEMPVMKSLIDSLSKERPLAGIRISGCLHITSETANLGRALKAAGAHVVLCASNPLSTQDDVAAALAVHLGISVFAHRGDNHDRYYQRIAAALAHRPHITIDDGADLVSEIHKNRTDLLAELLGGTEETTTGVIRLRAMAAEGALRYPIIAVNDADTKHLFDNRYGTGQSTIDGFIRATNILLAGKVFTVCGYGWCGRGVAMRARGLGAKVVVTEVEPLRALEATMDGFQVMPLSEAAQESDFIVTATGDKHVIDRAHLEVMKDGCVIANTGHFDVEINIPALEAMADRKQQPRNSVEEFYLRDGRRIRLLAAGRLVNLAAAEGHPAAVMDMSFANQTLAAVYIRDNHNQLEPAVHAVPKDIDQEIARMKLGSLGVHIDQLTAEQQNYLSSWREGT
ncbi:MAG: adenosylhomocysteinase [Gammaproteobacteria bacterium]|jgi:adenosylhomocysteinase